MTDILPLVSIIIPCRNEEKYIGKCLDSIISQDYPKEKMEVLVVNGASEDRTKEITENYIHKYPFIKILENYKKFTPFALNIGIKRSMGEIIMRMDAHATYEKDYVSKCLKYLKKYKTDNVGGIMKTLPGENTIIAKAITLCLSHPFGVGNAYFRIGFKKPKFVDTVFGGCYRKKMLEKIGYFNENLARGQDMELNLRIRKFGGKTLFVPEIKSFYYARSDFKSFWSHSFMDGAELIAPLKFGVVIFSWRHLAPFFFILILIALGLPAFFFREFLWLIFVLVFLYLLINLYFSVKIAFAKRNFRYLFLMPIAFGVLHIGYGLGSVWGFLKLLWSKRFWENISNNQSNKIR